MLLLLNLCPFFVAGVSLWGQELVKRALIESLYGDLFQKSCQETSYGELVQRSCQEVSYLDLAKKKLPKRVCTEISYRDLAKRYPIEILCRDLARRPLIKILPLDLVNRACRDSLSRYVFRELVRGLAKRRPLVESVKILYGGLVQKTEILLRDLL